MKKYTPEQLRKIALYGKCVICGAPREHRITREGDGKSATYVAEMICENGHKGW